MSVLNSGLSGLLACSLVLSGGLFGVPQKDYDALKAENEALKAELEAVKIEYADFISRTPAAIVDLIFSGADPAAELEAASQSQNVSLGETARIETEYGVYNLTVLDAQFLSAESWQEDRYVISFELYNESFTPGVTLYIQDFQLFDADGYLCSPTYSSEYQNLGQTIPTGKRCLCKAVFSPNVNVGDFVELVFPARNVVFSLPVAQ